MVKLLSEASFRSLAIQCFKRRYPSAWAWIIKPFVSCSGDLKPFNMCIALVMLCFLVYLVLH